jgi:CheY-like chemotaxis protein
MSCFTVLMADDDADDRFLVEQACLAVRSSGDLHFVEDGEELMHYLRHTGNCGDPTVSRRPALILLDLNMPKKDGRQVLAEMKADPELQELPIVIWTTSNEEEDRIQCLKAGADDYVTKPAGYAELVSNIKRLLTRYNSQTICEKKM